MKLTRVQSDAVKASIQEAFNEWYKRKREVHAAHVATLITATDIRVVRLRQTGIATIVKEIKDREEWTEKMLQVVEDSTEQEREPEEPIVPRSQQRRIAQNFYQNWVGFTGKRKRMDFGPGEQGLTEARKWLNGEPCGGRVVA